MCQRVGKGYVSSIELKVEASVPRPSMRETGAVGGHCNYSAGGPDKNREQEYLEGGRNELVQCSAIPKYCPQHWQPDKIGTIHNVGRVSPELSNFILE